MKKIILKHTCKTIFISKLIQCWLELGVNSNKFALFGQFLVLLSALNIHSTEHSDHNKFIKIDNIRLSYLIIMYSFQKLITIVKHIYMKIYYWLFSTILTIVRTVPVINFLSWNILYVYNYSHKGNDMILCLLRTLHYW